MNQYDPYDPTKENGQSPDQKNTAEQEDGRDRPSSEESASPPETVYTYTSDRPEDGQQYVNPDGSHGFIYNSTETPKDAGRRYRSAVIVLSAALATVVIAAGCLMGAYLVTSSLTRGGDSDALESGADVETSGGLFIDDDEDAVNRGDGSSRDPNGETDTPDGSGAIFSPDGSNAGQNTGANSSHNSGQMKDPAPAVDSIQKRPSTREDIDGDGKAEIETDETGEVLTSAGKNVLSVATVVHRVAASVVEITTETIVQSGYIGQYIASGAGSGVVISADGYVVTNHHVIDGANTITVRMNNGTEFPATLVGTDEQTDVAVLRIDAGNYPLTVATLGSSFDLVVGEDILAIGNPLGSLGGTVTEGMISATARDININGTNMTLLQVSAPINPGNSGGGLFNLAGELVGVVNAKMSSEEIEGLGFAIPVDTAYEIILELIEFGYVRGRPAIDFTVVDVTDVGTAMRYFSSFNLGVYVYDDSHTVMKYGDLVLAADGVEIKSVSDLEAVISSKQVGDTLELIIYRNERQQSVTVTLIEKTP